jgi:galactitol-specific phosphotransferase system IIB component
MENTVNAIIVRNTYNHTNEVFKKDSDGDLIVFSNDYNTQNVTVKDMLLLINKRIDKTEIKRLLNKVIDKLNEHNDE